MPYSSSFALQNLVRLSHFTFLTKRFSRLYLMLSLLICIILPNPGMNILMGTERLFWNWIDFGFLAFFCFSLTFLGKKMFRWVWWFCFVIELGQFSHLAYFGTLLSPDALLLLFHEHRDIFDPAYITHTWFVLPLLLISYGLGDWLFRHFSSFHKKRPYLGVLLVMYSISLLMTDGLTLRPKRCATVLKHQPDWLFHRYCMRTPSLSLKKTFFTGACALSQTFLLPSWFEHSYAPYQLVPSPTAVQNIVLIMGESLNCDHLSLFGYNRKTTPHLDTLASHPFFLSKPAYSAAPQTKTSVMYFFNVVREPDNLKELQGGECNLFKRAKANGFKTFLITNNDGSRSMGPDIDVVYSSLLLDNAPHASYPALLRDKKDRGLASLLKEIPLADKNFVVLHMRAPHSPYERSYAAEPSLKSLCFHTPASSFLVENYDKAVRYVDLCFHEIFTTFKEVFATQGNSLLWMIADHSELFGETDALTGEKRYGHGHMTLSTLRVPVWVTSLEKHEGFMLEAFKDSHAFSAYDVGKLLLRCMGDILINPQEDPHIGYATSGLMGDILTYTKKEGGQASLVTQKAALP